MLKGVIDFSNNDDVLYLLEIMGNLGKRLLIGEGDTGGFIRKKQWENYDVFLCYPQSSPRECTFLEENAMIIENEKDKIIICLDLNNKRLVEIFCGIFNNFFDLIKLDMDAKEMELTDIQQILSEDGKYEPMHYTPTTLFIPELFSEINSAPKSVVNIVLRASSYTYLNPNKYVQTNVHYRIMDTKTDVQTLKTISGMLDGWTFELSGENNPFKCDESQGNEYDQLCDHIKYSLRDFNILLLNFWLINFHPEIKLQRELVDGRYCYVKNHFT